MVNSKLAAGQCRLHTTVSGDSGILSLGIAFLHLSSSAGSRGKRKTVALFPSSKLPLHYITACYTTFFPILIVLYKLRCIASNSMEEFIYLFLFIYLQVTYLHHYLHIFTPLFTHIYTIIYTYLHHYLHILTPLFTHIYTIIYTY